MSFLDFLSRNYAADFNDAITGYAIDDSVYTSSTTLGILIFIAAVLFIIAVMLFLRIRDESKPSLRQLYRLIFESQTAINYNNLELARHRYLEALGIYKSLNKSEKSRVFPILSEVYTKRKQAEQTNLSA